MMPLYTVFHGNDPLCNPSCGLTAVQAMHELLTSDNRSYEVVRDSDNVWTLMTGRDGRGLSWTPLYSVQDDQSAAEVEIARKLIANPAGHTDLEILTDREFAAMQADHEAAR